jgi:hypothetical protein
MFRGRVGAVVEPTAKRRADRRRTETFDGAESGGEFDHAANKARFAAYLTATGQHERARKVQDCCSQFCGFICAGGHSHQAIPTSRCGERLDSRCAAARQARTVRRLSPVVLRHQAAHPKDLLSFITLTTKRSPATVAERRRQLDLWFKQLRRTALWRRGISGAVSGFDLTASEARGTHPHIHILAFASSPISRDDLAAEWERITSGEGSIVDKSDHNGGSVAEMVGRTLNYISKPLDIREWTDAQLAEFDELRGAQLVKSHGGLRGTKPAPDADFDDDGDDGEARPSLRIGSPCPDCGLPLKWGLISAGVVFADEARRRLAASDWLIRNRGSGGGAVH